MRCQTQAMKKITMPKFNMNVSDDVLAQTICAQHDWMMDSAGRVYDQDSVIVARSLPELSKAMRDLNWFTPRGTASTGVNWKSVPHEGSQCAEAVRAQLK